MKKWFPLVSQLLIVAALVAPRLQIELNDFVHGLMLGVGIVGVLYGAAQFSKRPRPGAAA